MIKVNLYEDQKGLCGFLADGHAEYAEPGETDEVCAGITSLAGSLVVSLTDLLKLELVEYSLKPGRLWCKVDKIPDSKRNEADLLFKSFKLGCEQISFSYGQEYVQVQSEPVDINREEENV